MQARTLCEGVGVVSTLEEFYRQVEIEQDIPTQFELESIWQEYKRIKHEEIKRNGK